MSKKELQETLANKKFLIIFEEVSKEISTKRKEIAEKLSMKGLLHSGVHVRSIVNLELNGLRKLLDYKFRIDKDVFFKDSKPYSNEDENFLKKRLQELFNARIVASKKSLSEYCSQLRLPSQIDYFDREASSIFF